MYAIEQGIEIPGKSAGAPRKYPLNDMKKGDSFLVPKGKKPSIAAAASRVGKQLGRKFTIRATAEGVRVWRIK